MKIPGTSNNINALLAEVGTDYFDLLFYHYPFSMFDSKAQLEQSWIHMTELPKATVKRIGVSNFYASHFTKLFDVCQELNLQKPFANEIQINPYVFCLEKNTLDLCFQNSIQLIAYSPLGFNAAFIVLKDKVMQSIAEKLGITTAQLTLAWLLSKRICFIPKSNNILRQEKTLLPRTLSIMSYTFLMTWTRSQKVKIPEPTYSILLKNPRKTPTDCAGRSGMMMISIYCGYLGSLAKVLAFFPLTF